MEKNTIIFKNNFLEYKEDFKVYINKRFEKYASNSKNTIISSVSFFSNTIL